jgi:hypothetical protein
MASSKPRKTTIAHDNRERNSAGRGSEKHARNAAQRQAATHDGQAPDRSPAQEAAQPVANRPAVDAATDPQARAVMSMSSVALLEAEARFHRERLALYRARRYAGRPTSEVRFRQLEQAADVANGRLLLARRTAAHLN